MTTPVAGSLRPADITWIKTLFGAPVMKDKRLRRQRLYTNAQTSFADTTVGGNQAINSPPQFTRFADPAVGGLFANPKNRSKENQRSFWENQNNVGSYRLGGFYQEAIEDNAAYLHLRFGKPKYLGSIAFFANMYDSNLAYMARTGDYPGIAKTIGGYIGAAAIYAFTGGVAFAALLIIPRVLKMVLNKDVSRYYQLKPSMHLYLRAVQNIANTQLLHYRLVPISTIPFMGTQFDGIDSDKNKYNPERAELYSALPDIWKSNGEFDVYKMVNRYQVLANYQARTFEGIYANTTTPEERQKKLEQFYKDARFKTAMRNRPVGGLRDLEEHALNSRAYTSEIFDAGDPNTERMKAMAQVYDTQVSGESNEASTVETGESGPTPADRLAQVQNTMDNETFWGSFLDYVQDITGSAAEQVRSELLQGGQWITWKINAKDSVSHSFSNSTKEPEVSSAVNGLTSKARSLEVNTAGGNTGIAFADAAVKGVKGLFSATLETLELTGLAALYNSSVIDFQDVWDSSDCGSNEFSFTIQCRAWSGNDLDVFQDVILPICFWLPAAAPIATGKQSYTHPFYCEAYSRGRFSGRTCIVTSLSITTGTGGIPFRADGVPLGCDITVTIRDLSKALFMPIVTDPSTFDNDNKFTEFMSVLGAASLHERIYGFDKATFNFNNWKQSWKSAFTVGARTNQVFSGSIAGIVSSITGGTAR